MAAPTANQIALVKQLGLKLVLDKPTGKYRILTEKGLIPNGQEITDVYYPTLFQKVIAQSVEDQLGKVKGLENVFNRETWENGVKEYSMVGLFTDNDYAKEITIGDLNADDPTMEVLKFAVDQFKYVKAQLTADQVIQAFTTPATLETFVGLILKRLLDTFAVKFQNIKAKIILQQEDALVQIGYDTIVDTTDMSTEEILTLATEIVTGLETASADHLALTDDTIVYSADKSNLSIIKGTKFNSEIEMGISAKLFGAENLSILKVENDNLAFDKIAGIDADAASRFKMAIIDKRALKMGLQLNNESWTVKLPKRQQLNEVHYWYGFGALPNYAKIIFQDAAEVPPAKKGYAPKVYIGKKLYKAIKDNGTIAGVDLKKLQK